MRFGLLAVVLGACASQHMSHLDGPVDYDIEGGFARTRTSVHLELDGSVTKQVTTGSGPTMTSRAMVAATAMAELRDDIAGVDLASLRDSYSCADFACGGADFPVVTLTIAADGSPKQIRVDRGISEHDLPAGLVAILADLDAIVSQIP